MMNFKKITHFWSGITNTNTNSCLPRKHPTFYTKSVAFFFFFFWKCLKSILAMQQMFLNKNKVAYSLKYLKVCRCLKSSMKEWSCILTLLSLPCLIQLPLFPDFGASFFHEYYWTHGGMLDLWKSKGLRSVQLLHSRKYMRLMITRAEYIKLNHSAPQKRRN